VGTEVAVSDQLGRDVRAFKGARHRQSGRRLAHDVPSDLRQAARAEEAATDRWGAL
jgi:hypothetical protein